MPRVSEEHLAARRQQILDAARVCFTRNGFHATTMHDVIREAGLSVGAVYRYFRSKEDLVAALTEQVVAGMAGQLTDTSEAGHPRSVAEAMEHVLAVMGPQLGDQGMFRIALQFWAESLRSAELHALVERLFGTLRTQFRAYAEILGAEDPDALASVLVSLAQGYALQFVLTGQPSVDEYLRGVRALTAESGVGGVR